MAKCYFCIQRFPSSSLDGDRFFLCPIINKFRGSKKSMGAQVLPKIAILQQLTAVMGPISPLFSKNSDWDRLGIKFRTVSELGLN